MNPPNRIQAIINDTEAKILKLFLDNPPRCIDTAQVKIYYGWAGLCGLEV